MNGEESLKRQTIFNDIHQSKAWGDGESVSGPGSSKERAASFLPALVDLMQRRSIATLLDVPCGDFNWAGPLADAVDNYIGIDIVPELIQNNRQRYGSPRRRFECLDMVYQALPNADLVLCRDGLVHFSDSDAKAALANLRRTNAEYLLVTTFIGDRSNPDIATGEWRPLNMQSPPFSFPEPLELVDEHCHHTGGAYSDKRFGLWRFYDL